ncbi:C-type lectin lectoxin-Phi1-like isoform X2 [Cherax quadricarinatus]|uniref:C-type lectin lectoxin-Phi1-like isoform X2 n=1 Tax=Cherax quadricarinatus TaxID=27406 RepID=UPI00387EE4A1
MAARLNIFWQLSLLLGALAQNTVVEKSTLTEPAAIMKTMLTVKTTPETGTKLKAEFTPNPDTTPEDDILKKVEVTLKEKILSKLMKQKLMQHLPCSDDICCPYPYTQVLDECFYLSSHSLKWHEARIHCQGMHGDLASPKHIYALKSYIMTKAGLLNVYVGGKKNHPGYREWTWVDGRKIHISEWAHGEPNNFMERELCTNLEMEKYPMLNDDSCPPRWRAACPECCRHFPSGSQH